VKRYLGKARKPNFYLHVVILLSIPFFNANALSKCVFPSADGHIDASPPNIEGELVEVTSSTLVISGKKNKKEVKVELTKGVDYFTAFGGFVRLDELRPGQYIWMWYENCSSSNADIQKAKVVKVYSLDPNDKP
jgi:hypothetical protein